MISNKFGFEAFPKISSCMEVHVCLVGGCIQLFVPQYAHVCMPSKCIDYIEVNSNWTVSVMFIK